ncbi:MAG TPA: sulfatase-like hydrolase/transferase [Candidatus Polarisedimenticolaceae bacterium]|nr:sulfatase-like hydrolase/transferase [Candidatus Polarisedimenticolaceae bacterium]
MGKKTKKSRLPSPPAGPATKAPDGSAQHRKGRSAIALVAVLVVLAAVGWAGFSKFRSGPRLTPGSLAGDSVILITLDTTRADHLPMYGYQGVRTPGLDRLAAESLVFENAIAHVPLTLPSHTSILTGRLPIAHGVRDNEGYKVDAKIPTLAEVLKGRGYATAAFVSAFVLDGRFGLGRGFDLYFDKFNAFAEANRDEIQRKAEDTEAEVERWLPEHTKGPFFLWVHFYDPHEPYAPPEPFFTSYAANRYDGEIAYMDRSIERLLGKLRDAGILDRSVVVVTGDHGEGLGDHGELTHAMFLYRSTLHVPLLMRLPGGRAARIPGVVRHVDLAPTILDLLGIQAPQGMQGASLVPLISGREGDDRPAYSESLYAKIHYGWSPLAALTQRKYEMIDAPKPELYDNTADPAQKRNLIQDKAEVASDLKEQMQGIASASAQSDTSSAQPMDADTEQRLRSLGYLGSTAQATGESLKIDPKDKLDVVAAVAAGLKAFAAKDYQRALQGILPVTQSDPNIVEAHYVAGASFAQLGLYDQAQDQLFKALALKPDHTMSLAMLGWSYQGKGKLDEAERWYLKALKNDESDTLTLAKLSTLYRAMHRTADADRYFARAVAPLEASLATTQDPATRSRLLAARAETYFGADRLDLARADLESAIALTPREPQLHFNLAQIYEKQHDADKAIAAYEAETQISPSSFDAYMNLGMLSFNRQRFDAAANAYRALARIAPQDPRPPVLLAEAYMRMGTNLDEALRLAQTGLMQMGESPEIYSLIAAIQERLGHTQEAAQAQARAQALQRH